MRTWTGSSSNPGSSHRAAAEWMATLARSGFQAIDYRTWRVRMDFPVWLARLGAPESSGIAIRALQATAPAETRAHFSIEPDGSFMLDVMMIQATAGKEKANPASRASVARA